MENFCELSRTEQLKYLKELSNPKLSDHEIEVVNYLRNHSLDATIDYFTEKRLQEYKKFFSDKVLERLFTIQKSILQVTDNYLKSSNINSNLLIQLGVIIKNITDLIIDYETL